MDPRVQKQRRGAVMLLVFLALVLGITSGVIIATGLDWVPQSVAQTLSQNREVEPADFLVATQQNFRNLVAAVRPAVVSIETEGARTSYNFPVQPFGFPDPFEFFFGDPFDQQNRQRDQSQPREQTYRTMSEGSGFLVDRDGYILTNNHMVEGATEITVTLDDGRRLKAEIVGTDPETDVAVLKIEENEGPFPYIDMGDSDDLEVGDWVMAIGNPFGTLSGTVTVGIISAKHREHLELPGNTYYKDFIQTDAAINLGNSGGPLVDIYGRAVGISTAITAQGSGIGFAIPIDLARFVYENVLEHGEVIRGWVGITIQELDPDLAQNLGLRDLRGALIAEVHAGDPADKAGLREGDVLLEVDGRDVTSVQSASRMIASLTVGKPADFLIWRDGREMTLTVTPTRRGEGPAPAEKEETREQSQKPPEKVEYLGMEVTELDRNMRSSYDIPEEVTGVLVTSVDPDSPAYEKGIQEGAVITSINHQPVENLDDYETLMAEAQRAWDNSGQTVLMRVYTLTSDGQWFRRFVAVPFE